MWKEKTTWVGIFTGIVVLGLTAAVWTGHLTGTEYAAALGGVSGVGLTILAIVTGDRSKAKPDA